MVRRMTMVGVFAVAAAALVWTASGGDAARAAVDGARFVPVEPQRLLDTRPGQGPADDGVDGVVQPGGLIEVQVTGRMGVPSGGVSAVVLNVTMTEALAPGFVQVLPAGAGNVGSSSNLNVERAGQTIANQVTVPVGAGGRVALYAQSGGHLLADVSGYYTPTAAATAGRYVPLASGPVRLVDTRSMASVPTVDPGDTLSCRDFPNWDAAWRWYWTYFPRWGDRARLDDNGNGIPCEGIPFVGRVATPPADVFALRAGGTLRLPITTGTDLGGGLGDPGSISAVVATVTVANAAAPGFWQVVPSGVTPGGASHLNADRAGQSISNQVIVPVGADGTITVFSQTGGHVIVDVAGVVTGPASPASSIGLFVPITPSRFVDTRDVSNTPRLGPIPPGTAVDVATSDRFGIPAGSLAVAANATITASAGSGFVQVSPPGLVPVGASSNLNVETAGQTKSTAVYAAVDAGGRFSIYTQGGGELLADVAGFFTGAETASAGPVPTPEPTAPPADPTPTTAPPAPTSTPAPSPQPTPTTTTPRPSTTTTSTTTTTTTTTSTTTTVPRPTTTTTSTTTTVPRPTTTTTSTTTTTAPPPPPVTTTPPPPGTRPIVYFTFDDGPGAEYTLPVLDLLSRYGVRATFFLVGRNVAAEPSVAQEIVRRGHVLGNHTWDHPNLADLSADAIRSQLSRTQDAITAATGARPRCMRPPFGAVNGTVQSTVTAAGYSIELWTLDTRDFEATSADQIIARLNTLLTSSATVHNVLMHDWATHTPAALDRWLAANASRFDFRVMPTC